MTSCYLKFASFSIFCTVSEYYLVVTKKITKKLPDVRYTLQKTACRYLDWYRNDKGKKSGYKKKTPGTIKGINKHTHLKIKLTFFVIAMSITILCQHTNQQGTTTFFVELTRYFFVFLKILYHSKYMYQTVVIMWNLYTRSIFYLTC